MPAVWFGYDLDVLIGRDAEISMLRSLLERAATGRSQVLVVTGDAGIGKSALLEYAGQLSPDPPMIMKFGGFGGVS